MNDGDLFRQSWSPKIRRWICLDCQREYKAKEAHDLVWDDGYRCECGGKVTYRLCRPGARGQP